MKKQSPIVVGIDFSASSPFVLQQAADLARLHDSRVIAVHVLNASALQHWQGDNRKDAHEALSSQAEFRLTEMVREAAPDLGITCQVCVGRPADELNRVVTRHNASLLIIAANDMSKSRLGSIASRCARSVASDVLIVRNWQEGDFRKIVACTDLAARSSGVVVKAIEMAEANQSALEIVHVIYPPEKDYWGESIDDGGDTDESYPQRVRSRATAALDSYLEPYAGRLRELDFSPVILESTVPSVELTYHIKQTGADLAVLGTRVYSKLASIFVGTNAERLLHDAPVSVLAVRH